MEDVVVEEVPAATDEVRALIGELDQVLSQDYPPEQRHALSLDAIFQPHIRFFLARLGGAVAGCGGVALFPDFAEVKRMSVRDAARGRGVADALLARIEREVRGAGLAVLRLETGTKQLAAIRLYSRVGFQTCPPFGAYAAMPPRAIHECLLRKAARHARGLTSRSRACTSAGPVPLLSSGMPAVSNCRYNPC